MKILHNCFSVFTLTVLLIALMNNSSFSQNKGEFSILYGYQMLGSVEVYNYNNNGNNINGDLDINDSPYYSAALGFNPNREVMVELQYIFQPTSIEFDPYTAGFNTQSFDADVHYILLTGYYVKKFSKTGSGYAGISMGAAGLVPDANYDPAWRVAFGFTIGAKFLLSKNIGIKLQSQALFPIQWASGSLYVGSGGSGFATSVGTSIVQINVGGGLFYAF